VQALLSPGDNLGLVIRGGAEYGVGVFVIQVDPGSVAEKLGLKVILTFFIAIITNKHFSLVTSCMR
jgi:hypothetical protein